MEGQGNLFESLSKEEYDKVFATEPKAPKRTRKVVTEPRTNTVWNALPSHAIHMGFCTCPNHDEIQKLLNPTALVYRQKYPVRMCLEISEGLHICRDCFVHEGDK